MSLAARGGFTSLGVSATIERAVWGGRYSLIMDDPVRPKTPDPFAPPPAATSHGPLLLGLLFGALVSQDLVWPVVLRMTNSQWPATPAIVAMGIGFAQLGLAAVLLVLGSGRPAIRGVATIALYVGAALLAFRSVNEQGLGRWLAIMLFVMAVISAPLIIARLAGVAIGPTVDSPPSRGSRQYTIWGLLVLTTVVAVLLGIARQLKFPWHELGQIALFSWAIAVIPCILAPLALSKIAWPASLIAGATLCPAAGALLTLTGFPPPEQPLELATMCSIQGAVTIAACAVVRIAGYRLVLSGW